MDCENCPYVKIIDDMQGDIKVLRTDVEMTKINNAKNEQQLKTLFNTITEIKDSIKEILKEIKGIKEQPAQEYSNIKTAIIKTIISLIVGGIIGFILKGTF